MVLPHYMKTTTTIRQSLGYESGLEIRSLDEMGHRRYESNDIDMKVNRITSQACYAWSLLEAVPLDLMDVRPIAPRAYAEQGSHGNGLSKMEDIDHDALSGCMQWHVSSLLRQKPMLRVLSLAHQ